MPYPILTAARICAAALFALALQGCASDQQKIDAINAVDKGFRVEYEKLLAKDGTHVYKVSPSEAFVAMRVTLAGMGMRTVQQDVALGHLAVEGSAPLPLTDEEWRSASQADLPLLRQLIEPYVGLGANFVKFDPQGLNVVVNATVLEGTAGTEVSLTVRLRETAPPRSGWPRRTYIGPHILRAGLDKIFGTFENELRAGPKS